MRALSQKGENHACYCLIHFRKQIQGGLNQRLGSKSFFIVNLYFIYCCKCLSLSIEYAFAIFFRFVFDIFKEDGKCKNLNVICKIPLMVPKVSAIVMFELFFLNTVYWYGGASVLLFYFSMNEAQEFYLLSIIIYGIRWILVFFLSAFFRVFTWLL